MKDIRDSLDLTLRSLVFIYIPIVSLGMFLYQGFFGSSIRLQWFTFFVYFGILSQWMISRYKPDWEDAKVTSMIDLEHKLMADNWEVIDRRRDALTVRPGFDRPFNFVVNDKVEIQYLHQKVRIKGPKHYVVALTKVIQGDTGHKKHVLKSNIGQLIVAFFVLMPLISESGILWEAKVLRHNVQANSSQVLADRVDSQAGNSVENINNGGYGATNEEYLFLVENDSSLTRINKETEEKDYIIWYEDGRWFSDLNVIDEWVYFTDANTLKRINIDGTHEETLYDLGALYDVHIVNGWIYFINGSDDLNLYRMDLDGGNLERLLDVYSTDIAVYEDYLLVSHGNEGVNTLERLDLDGSNREVILDGPASDVVIWDEYYYYLGVDYDLNRIRIDGTSEPKQLIPNQIRTYNLTDEGIVYVLQSEESIYPGNGVYTADLDGRNTKLIDQTQYAEYLIKTEESVLYNTFGSFDYETLESVEFTE